MARSLLVLQCWYSFQACHAISGTQDGALVSRRFPWEQRGDPAGCPWWAEVELVCAQSRRDASANTHGSQQHVMFPRALANLAKAFWTS